MKQRQRISCEKQARGFTVLEVMVVLAISLLMMMMIVPIFRITTRTVSTVERKLAVYEAARMLLDYYEAQLQLAVVDSRGNQFGLKSREFIDQDPFTPAGSTSRYAHSLRHADVVSYFRLPAESRYTAYASGWPMALFHPAWDGEGTLCYIATQTSSCAPSAREPFLLDVASNYTKGEALEHFYANQYSVSYQDPPANTIRLYSMPGPPAKGIAPGFEADGLGYYENGDTHGANMATLSVLDFDLAYWDQTALAYLPLPPDSACYFAPPPKSIRVSITVTDDEKRLTVTLQRIVRIHTGTHPGSINTIALDAQMMTPSPYNRLKSLQSIFPKRYP